MKTYIKRKIKSTKFYSIIKVLRSSFNNYLIDKQKKYLKKKISSYYSNVDDKEINELVSFLNSNSVQMIPYEYTKNYVSKNIEVFTDYNSSYQYVLINDLPVYFPNEMSQIEIKNSVRCSLMEQDISSPHKYLSEDFKLENANISILVGASDGIFALSIIEKTKKLYLFEADSKWIKPLELTLKKWRSKVEIINKYVSDKDDEECISLDNYFRGRINEISYIQADIEGAEEYLLNGAKEILNENKPIKLSICCYHKSNDEFKFTKLLEQYKFSIGYSNNYMVMWMQYPLKKPYLRRGIIYATKIV